MRAHIVAPRTKNTAKNLFIAVRRFQNVIIRPPAIIRVPPIRIGTFGNARNAMEHDLPDNEKSGDVKTNDPPKLHRGQIEGESIAEEQRRAGVHESDSRNAGVIVNRHSQNCIPADFQRGGNQEKCPNGYMPQNVHGVTTWLWPQFATLAAVAAAANTDYFTHTSEGPDDSTSHIRMVLTRSSDVIPNADGRLQLGTWQGIFLFEHRRPLAARDRWRPLGIASPNVFCG